MCPPNTNQRTDEPTNKRTHGGCEPMCPPNTNQRTDEPTNKRTHGGCGPMCPPNKPPTAIDCSRGMINGRWWTTTFHSGFGARPKGHPADGTAPPAGAGCIAPQNNRPPHTAARMLPHTAAKTTSDITPVDPIPAESPRVQHRLGRVSGRDPLPHTHPTRSGCVPDRW